MNTTLTLFFSSGSNHASCSSTAKFKGTLKVHTGSYVPEQTYVWGRLRSAIRWAWWWISRPPGSSRYVGSSWTFSPNQTCEGLLLSSWSHTVLQCRYSPVASGVEDVWSAYSAELSYEMYLRKVFFFNERNTVSCSRLLNAECCISLSLFFFFLFTATPMSHSHGTFWFPVLSPSVFSPFLRLMFFWSNNLSQRTASLWSTIIVVACIQTHSVSQ